MSIDLSSTRSSTATSVTHRIVTAFDSGSQVIQNISLPIPDNDTKSCELYANFVISTFYQLMLEEALVTSLKVYHKDSVSYKPSFDERDSVNKKMENMLKYTYEYIRRGGDENAAERLFGVFDLMFMQIHEYYRQFDNI